MKRTRVLTQKNMATSTILSGQDALAPTQNDIARDWRRSGPGAVSFGDVPFVCTEDTLDYPSLRNSVKKLFKQVHSVEISNELADALLSQLDTGALLADHATVVSLLAKNFDIPANGLCALNAGKDGHSVDLITRRCVVYPIIENGIVTALDAKLTYFGALFPDSTAKTPYPEPANATDFIEVQAHYRIQSTGLAAATSCEATLFENEPSLVLARAHRLRRELDDAIASETSFSQELFEHALNVAAQCLDDPVARDLVDLAKRYAKITGNEALLSTDSKEFAATAKKKVEGALFVLDPNELSQAAERSVAERSPLAVQDLTPLEIAAYRIARYKFPNQEDAVVVGDKVSNLVEADINRNFVYVGQNGELIPGHRPDEMHVDYFLTFLQGTSAPVAAYARRFLHQAGVPRIPFEFFTESMMRLLTEEKSGLFAMMLANAPGSPQYILERNTDGSLHVIAKFRMRIGNLSTLAESYKNDPAVYELLRNIEVNDGTVDTVLDTVCDFTISAPNGGDSFSDAQITINEMRMAVNPATTYYKHLYGASVASVVQRILNRTPLDSNDKSIIEQATLPYRRLENGKLVWADSLPENIDGKTLFLVLYQQGLPAEHIVQAIVDNVSYPLSARLDWCDDEDFDDKLRLLGPALQSPDEQRQLVEMLENVRSPHYRDVARFVVETQLEGAAFPKDILVPLLSKRAVMDLARNTSAYLKLENSVPVLNLDNIPEDVDGRLLFLALCQKRAQQGQPTDDIVREVVKSRKYPLPARLYWCEDVDAELSLLNRALYSSRGRTELARMLEPRSPHYSLAAARFVASIAFPETMLDFPLDRYPARNVLSLLSNEATVSLADALSKQNNNEDKGLAGRIARYRLSNPRHMEKAPEDKQATVDEMISLLKHCSVSYAETFVGTPRFYGRLYAETNKFSGTIGKRAEFVLEKLDQLKTQSPSLKDAAVEVLDNFRGDTSEAAKAMVAAADLVVEAIPPIGSFTTVHRGLLSLGGSQKRLSRLIDTAQEGIQESRDERAETNWILRQIKRLWDFLTKSKTPASTCRDETREGLLVNSTMVRGRGTR